MALDKNDGTFSPSIEGVISGKTSQVDGMNGLLNDLIGNDNYLKDKKLDRGNYTGTAEKLHTDSDAIWGGLDGGGLIEDPSVTKVVGKRYIGADGKGYICKVPSNINNSENYTPCNVVDNLDKLQNLNIEEVQTGWVHSTALQPNNFEEIYIKFPKKFKKIPIVTCSIGTAVQKPSSSTLTDRQELQVYTPTTEGVYVRWFNLAQSAVNGRRIQWIAIV